MSIQFFGELPIVAVDLRGPVGKLMLLRQFEHGVDELVEGVVGIRHNRLGMHQFAWARTATKSARSGWAPPQAESPSNRTTWRRRPAMSRPDSLEARGTPLAIGRPSSALSSFIRTRRREIDHDSFGLARARSSSVSLSARVVKPLVVRSGFRRIGSVACMAPCLGSSPVLIDVEQLAGHRCEFTFGLRKRRWTNFLCECHRPNCRW